MRELRDLYDRNGNRVEYTYYKGEKIPEGYYPIVVMIAIHNTQLATTIANSVIVSTTAATYDED